MGSDTPMRKQFCALILSALWFACGDDGGGEATKSATPDAVGGGEFFVYNGTLVSILAVDETMRIGVPHLIELRNNETGAPFDPPITTMSAPETGAISYRSPKGIVKQLWVRGTGTGTDATYDTVLVNASSETSDKLIRIASSGLVSIAEGSAGFKGRSDRAALAGGIYWTPNKTRMDTVGCAKVYLDGATGPDVEQDQFYNAANGLPAPRTCPEPAGGCVPVSQTLSGGRFYFGNVKVGNHTLKVSLDDGKTFVGETKIFVPYSRAEAASPSKNVLVQMAIDLDVPANPTPAGCTGK